MSLELTLCTKNAHPPLSKGYVAAFKMGCRQTLHDRVDFVSTTMIYLVLLYIFSTIFRHMPLHELNVAGLRPENMIWYLAMTECIMLGSPGGYTFGAHIIAQGRLSEFLTRPNSLSIFILCWLWGRTITLSLLLFLLSLVIVPLLYQAPLPIELWKISFVVMTIVLSCVILQLIGFIASMVEIFGPFSTQVGWMMSKMTFVLGGLYFPVIFFPLHIQHFAFLTPFPSVLNAVGVHMLPVTDVTILCGFLMQILWLAILLTALYIANKWMIRYVMKTGV